MSDEPQAPKRLIHIPAFDGFRGLGVLIVIFSHFPAVIDSNVYNYLWKINQVSRIGYIALDIFFAISGFFITRMLLLERQTTGRISFLNFYTRRALRIFPIYYISIFVCFFVFHFGFGDTVSLLTYTFNIYHPFHSAPHPLEHTWSLSVEEQFYFIWPLLILLVPMRMASFVTGRLVPLFAIFCGFMIGIWIGTNDNALAGDVVYMSLFTRMLSVSLGGWMAVREFEGRPFRGWPCLVLMILAGSLLALDRIGRDVGIITSQGFYWTIALASYAMISVSFTGTIIFDRKIVGRWLRAFFSIWILRALGRISYALYLYHLPVLFYFGLNDGALNGDRVPLLNAAIAITIILALGVISYFVIERPLTRLRHGKSRWLTREWRDGRPYPDFTRWLFSARDYH